MSNDLGRRAYRVIEHLSVNIGPRPACSEGERRALDYIESELGRVCHQVRRTPVNGIPGQLPTKLLLLVFLCCLTYCVYWFVQAPRSMLIFVTASFALPKVISAIRKRGSAKAERASENVVGNQPAAGGACGTLVLCAHLDSAKANRVPGHLWLKMHRLFMRLLMPFVLIMCGLAALRWVDLRVYFAPPIVWQVARAVGVALSALFLAFESFYAYISRSDAYSPGANDNASGVGVVLTLARHFCEHPPDHLNMQYVLFTAEELGLVGSEAFVKGTDLSKADTWVINVDMVGTGKQLCYVRGSGLLPPRLTDVRLNELLKEAHPDIKRHYYFRGNSDFSSFVAKGFRAASLCTKGDPQARIVFHTERDTIEYVDEESLQITAEAIHQIVRLMGERIGEWGRRSPT